MEGYNFCRICKTSQKIENFPVRKSGKLFFTCRTCGNDATKKWRSKHPEYTKNYHKEYRARLLEKAKNERTIEILEFINRVAIRAVYSNEKHTDILAISFDSLRKELEKKYNLFLED